MSSTYSTNLAIELIGTGDQTGTWGSTTNSNLGTLVEQAISGYVTQAITDGADTVITIPNGASGVARNMSIECTGALTANRNLIVPANKKLYFIYNNTTGGYAVTVKVSGQTGVSVPAGAKIVLASNGTDVVQATNYMVSPTFVTPNLGTPSAAVLTNATGLPISTGVSGLGAGVATFLATPSSANLRTAVTDETGSGSLVFGTSPTLVTPLLGTPTSGTLTNCTGLPIATGVSGLGTGVATALAVNVGSAGAPVVNGGALGTPSSGTATNLTGLPLTTGVTGTLPVANGGTGITSLGTGVQTALGQAVTGSGGIALSTSPAFTTPNLGTPSAATLTNATGLPLTTGVTGTLPVANGGTGVTSSTGTGNVVLSASPTLTGTPLAPTAAYGTNTTQLATTAFVQAALQALYPVGTIYSSTVSTNPGTLFGFGTWVAYAAGRVLIGQDGSSFVAGATGGSADAVLVSHSHTFSATTSANGNHYHGFGYNTGDNSGWFGLGSWSGYGFPAANTTNWNGSGGGTGGSGNQTGGNMSTTGAITSGIGDNHTHTLSGTTSTQGSSATGANLQPYVVVYMWQRTA